MENVYWLQTQGLNSIFISPQIRWHESDELDLFNNHLKLCGQKECSVETWSKMLQEGTRYCGFFIENKMVARAAVEKYSLKKWEVADVRVVKEFRYQGYAKQVCYFVIQYILSNQKIATIRTGDNNQPMRAVIKTLGFQDQA